MKSKAEEGSRQTRETGRVPSDGSVPGSGPGPGRDRTVKASALPAGTRERSREKGGKDRNKVLLDQDWSLKGDVL